jgi:hypothetical protein
MAVIIAEALPFTFYTLMTMAIVAVASIQALIKVAVFVVVNNSFKELL